MEENRNKPPAFARYRRDSQGGRPDTDARPSGDDRSSSSSEDTRIAPPPGPAQRPPAEHDGPARGVGGFRPRHADGGSTSRPAAADEPSSREAGPNLAMRRPGTVGEGGEATQPLRQNIFTRGAQRRAEAAAIADNQTGIRRPGEGTPFAPSSWEENAREGMSPPAGDRSHLQTGYERESRPVYGQDQGPMGGPQVRGLERAAPAALGNEERQSGIRHIVAEDRPQPIVSRKAMIVTALTLLVFGLFGGVVYLAYQQTLGFSEDIPLVRAPDKPYKEPPEAGGGSDVASDSSNVMDVFSRQGDDARVERIMPRGAPSPMSLDQADPGLRERAAADATPSTPEGGAPASAPSDTSQLAALEAPPLGALPNLPAAPAHPAAATPPRAAPAPEASRQMPRTERPASQQPQPPAQTQSQPSMQDLPTQGMVATPPPVQPVRPPVPPAQAPAPANGTGPRSLFPSSGGQTAPASPPRTGNQVAALPSTPAPQAPAAASGGWRIQVAAVGSRQAAEDAWRNIRQRNPSIAGLPVSYIEAQIGNGRVVRVQAGSFADREAAARACQSLRTTGSDCFVVGVGR